jgi:hypothetical protein
MFLSLKNIYIIYNMKITKSAFDEHLLNKLKKNFETKRNEDQHHEDFRWNKIKHVNAIARKINFQKKVNKPKKKKLKTYDELVDIWEKAGTYIKLDGGYLSDGNNGGEDTRRDYFNNVLFKKFKKDIENLPRKEKRRLLEADGLY